MSVMEHENTESAAERGTHGLFKWTSWVHVGEGAAECEQRFEGCTEEEHFHAWVRLPNPYEIRDLTDKARAAQARRLRMLRDPESDAYVVLENDIEELRSISKELLANELIDRDWQEDYQEAIREVDALDDESWEPGEDDEDLTPPKRFAHIDQDREEYNRQRQLPEDQRSDTFGELEKSMAAYGEAIEVAMKQRQEPKRDRLIQRGRDELIEMIRRARVESAGEQEFLHEFNTWQWYVCTFRPKAKGTPNQRYWTSVAQMKYETPPEVIEAVQATFRNLEERMSRSRAAGNS
jgi:hypothetical protein